MGLPVAAGPTDLPLDPMDMPVDFGGELFLEVVINGASTRKIIAFRQEGDGGFSVDPSELEDAGILAAAAALDADGMIRIDRLPDVAFEYDALGQRILFTASDAQRAARVIDAQGSRSALGAEAGQAREARSSYGALLNYSLYAASKEDALPKMFAFQGASGAFEGRLFSPKGVFTQGFVVSATSDALYGSKRLDSTWSMSDPETMRTYRAGDLITGGLGWTRSARLAGVQVQRNFGLRSDLVTLPVPTLSGSAAVPSTVDVYLNGARRFSREVDAGPFRLANLPVVSGAGTARVVVRDASGKETAIETSFFAASELLAPGLTDFSAELGFGRRGFGDESNDYDERPMASGSLRYGVTDFLTMEAHAEGGLDIVNAGAGMVMAIEPLGTVSLAAAASRSEFGEGFQFTGSTDLELGPVDLRARVQRTFDDYQDIASIIDLAAEAEDGLVPIGYRPQKMVAQVSAALPLVFDPSSLGVSYTHTEDFGGKKTDIIGLSYSRSVFGRGTVYVSGFKDIGTDDAGFYAGLNVSFGGGYSSGTTLSSNGEDLTGGVSLAKSGGQEVGDYSWRIDDYESAERSQRSLSGRYKAHAAEFRGNFGQSDDKFRASGQMDGAIVVADSDIFFSHSIEDAFAVVDVGAPGVEVAHENRPVGRTNAKGKLLVPGLRSFEENRISIDPADLPLDTGIDSTREIVVPADRSGVTVRFAGGAASASALITFREPDGAFVELGATGRIEGSEEPFIVGYDGQGYIEGLSADNRIVIEGPSGARCRAEFPYEAKGGSQVTIPDVVCQPVA